MEKRPLVARVGDTRHMRTQEPKESLTDQAIALRQALLQGHIPQEVVDVMLVDWWRNEVSKA